MRGDALLLLDRLRQALDEALVAADELDLAFAAELGAPALLVLAPVGDELLGLRLGGAFRGLRLELLGERVVALPVGLICKLCEEDFMCRAELEMVQFKKQLP